MTEFLEALECSCWQLGLRAQSRETEPVGKCFYFVIFFSHLAMDVICKGGVEWEYEYCNNDGNAFIPGVGMRFH